MKKMINSLALIFTIVSLTSCSSESEGVNEPVESAKSYTHNANELELLDKVNEYRVSIGLNPLEIIEHISSLFSFIVLLGLFLLHSVLFIIYL